MTKCPGAFSLEFFKEKISKVAKKLGRPSFDEKLILTTKLCIEASKRISDAVSTSMAKDGLASSAWVVLMMLYSEDSTDIFASDICDFLGESKATVSRVVESLKQKDFITEEEHNLDRRKVVLKLTTTGQEYVKAKSLEHTLTYKKLYANVDLDALQKELIKIVKNHEI